MALAAWLFLVRGDDVPRADLPAGNEPVERVDARPADEAALVGRRAPSPRLPKTTPTRATAPEAEEASLLRITIRGRCLDSRGQALPLAVNAWGTGPHVRYAARSDSDADGRFHLTLEVPERCREVWVVGSGWLGGSPYVTYPEWFRLGTGSTEFDCFLVGRLGALIEGGVESPHDGVKLGGILLAQLAGGEPTPLSDWARKGLSSFEQVLTPDEAGGFYAFVRPGRFRLRTFSDAPALGEIREGVALPGATVDVGLLPLPSEPVAVTLRILDDEEQPLPGAWVQLRERAAHVITISGNTEALHFLADAEGEVRLPGLSGSLFPTELAVGSPDHLIQEVRLSGEASLEIVRLKRRPQLPVRLLGPGAMRMDAHDLNRIQATWSKVTAGENDAFSTPSGRLGARQSQHRIADRDHESRTLWTFRPAVGEYRLVIHLGASMVATQAVTVDDDLSFIEVQVDDGLATEVAVVVPSRIAPGAGTHLLVAELVPSSDEAPRLQVDAREILKAEGGPVPIWMPVGYKALALLSRNECLFPIVAMEHDIGVTPVTRIALELRDDVGYLRLGFTDPDGDRLGTPWPVFLVSLSSSSAPCERGIVSFSTGPDGESEVAVLPGLYEMRTDVSFLAGRARKRVTVMEGGSHEVTMALVE